MAKPSEKTSPRREAEAALEAAIGHQFSDRLLFQRALTHPSLGEGAIAVRHYERLEFLGDRVLGLLAAERLLALDPDMREGAMSPKLAALVNGKTCARVARKIKLGEALRMSPGEAKAGGRNKDNILGDACEALLGAIYVDGGMDPARAFFLKFWDDEFARVDADQSKDAKTQLQEWAQGRGLPLPEYVVISRTGPDHAPNFTVRVFLEGYEDETGEGRSLREAEKSAAMQMLIKREGKA